jgi:hypothetical protein
LNAVVARRITGLIGLLATLTIVACGSESASVLPFDGKLPLGTWGGDSAGLIVGDTATHLHVACTFGDISGRIPIDANGRFDVAGSYMLRAYPITIGPSVPARFVGRLDGSTVTVTVTVNDTVEHKTVTRGPVIVKLGDDPRLGPCPICRRPVITQHQ